MVARTIAESRVVVKGSDATIRGGFQPADAPAIPPATVDRARRLCLYRAHPADPEPPMSEPIALTFEGHVATAALTRPTMDPAFFDALEKLPARLAELDDLRAVVLHGPDKAFSYGLDLPATFKAHGRLFSGGGLAAERTELLALIRRWQAAFTAMAQLPVPTIAALHGWCIGGGLDLASACDVRLASRDAKISLRETKIAIVADLGSLQRLPALIGQGHTRELAFTGKTIDAQRAHAIGLVNDLFDDREAVVAAAHAMAREIAANPPLTVRGVKDVLDFGLGRRPEDGLSYVAAWNSAFLASEDLAEAVSAFMARREPVFKGR